MVKVKIGRRFCYHAPLLPQRLSWTHHPRSFVTRLANSKPADSPNSAAKGFAQDVVEVESARRKKV
jgi:hypothetical protein